MRWHLRVILLFPTLLLTLVSLGCGGSAGGTTIVPVSGRVLMDNKPLEHASVQFTPESKTAGEAGPLAVGTTDAEGRFTLKTVIKGKDVEGAVPGKHHVQISVVRSADPKAKTVHVPPKYNRNSKLEFTVPEGGTQAADFLNLKSK
jgi:hypothetical protein